MAQSADDGVATDNLSHRESGAAARRRSVGTRRRKPRRDPVLRRRGLDVVDRALVAGIHLQMTRSNGPRMPLAAGPGEMCRRSLWACQSESSRMRQIRATAPMSIDQRFFAILNRSIAFERGADRHDEIFYEIERLWDDSDWQRSIPDSNRSRGTVSSQ
jgi:hypothetical protein